MRKFLGLVILCSLPWAIPTYAGQLEATIIEENGGHTGKISWTILPESSFLPVKAGKGTKLSVNLNPGRYILSVDGDTQGRKQVEVKKNGVTSITVWVRKFY